MLLILSAPSGCGKTTIVDRLLKRHSDWVHAVSATTRKPRTGETDGVDYYFVSEDSFRKMEAVGEFLESAKVHGALYGTKKSYIFEQLKNGKTVVLAVDVQGAKSIKRVLSKEKNHLSIFILPPSIKSLRERLEGRRTDSAEEIDRRVKVAQDEIKEAGSYDHAVVNQNLDQTVIEIEKMAEQFSKGIQSK